MTTGILQFDLNIHASGQVQTHQCVNRLGARLEYVNQAFVRANLELIARVFVNVRRALYCELFDLGWQWNRSNDGGASTLRRLNDLFCRLIEHAMIVTFELNTNLLSSH